MPPLTIRARPRSWRGFSATAVGLIGRSPRIGRAERDQITMIVACGFHISLAFSSDSGRARGPKHLRRSIANFARSGSRRSATSIGPRTLVSRRGTSSASCSPSSIVPSRSISTRSFSKFDPAPTRSSRPHSSRGRNTSPGDRAARPIRHGIRSPLPWSNRTSVDSSFTRGSIRIARATRETRSTRARISVRLIRRSCANTVGSSGWIPATRRSGSLGPRDRRRREALRHRRRPHRRLLLSLSCEIGVRYEFRENGVRYQFRGGRVSG